MEGLCSGARRGEAGPAPVGVRRDLGGLLHGGCGLVLVGSLRGVGSYCSRDGCRCNRSCPLGNSWKSPLGLCRSTASVLLASLSLTCSLTGLAPVLCGPKGLLLPPGIFSSLRGFC